MRLKTVAAICSFYSGKNMVNSITYTHTDIETIGSNLMIGYLARVQTMVKFKSHWFKFNKKYRT